MTEYLSPVPVPAADALSPGIYREIYGMPMFARIPAPDLAQSAAFWTDGLGFVELFEVPGRLVHLRRWAFQDVLLAPADAAADPSPISISFSCVLTELSAIAERCERLRPGSTDGPREQPWNSSELEVVTPEGARVVMTAARPFVPGQSMPEL